jgi:hypothetical protein
MRRLSADRRLQKHDDSSTASRGPRSTRHRRSKPTRSRWCATPRCRSMHHVPDAVRHRAGRWAGSLCADPLAATRHPDADAARLSSRPKSARQRIRGEREDDDEGRDGALKTSFAAAFGADSWRRRAKATRRGGGAPTVDPRARLAHRAGSREFLPDGRRSRAVCRRGCAHTAKSGSGEEVETTARQTTLGLEVEQG